MQLFLSLCGCCCNLCNKPGCQNFREETEKYCNKHLVEIRCTFESCIQVRAEGKAFCRGHTDGFLCDYANCNNMSLLGFTKCAYHLEKSLCCVQNCKSDKYTLEGDYCNAHDSQDKAKTIFQCKFVNNGVRCKSYTFDQMCIYHCGEYQVFREAIRAGDSPQLAVGFPRIEITNYGSSREEKMCLYVASAGANQEEAIQTKIVPIINDFHKKASFFKKTAETINPLSADT